eukprot:54969-Pleurochrysis_carterae.AAC.4
MQQWLVGNRDSARRPSGYSRYFQSLGARAAIKTGCERRVIRMCVEEQEWVDAQRSAAEAARVAPSGPDSGARRGTSARPHRRRTTTRGRRLSALHARGINIDTSPE